jgi:DNA invertase Pin-like site-specific DNA recombinase
MRAAGYVRVSTSDQGDSGAGLAAQRAAIEATCEARGWTLVHVYEDVASGRARTKRGKGRPGFDAAVKACESGDADVLVAAKLDRLTRSIVDFGELLKRAERKGFALAVQDMGIDTSTANGKLIANLLMSLAEWERDIISERTRAALAARKSQGVRLGRPGLGSMPVEVRRRIARARRRGESYARIAARLNAEGVPTAQGGARWYPATVRKAVTR